MPFFEEEPPSPTRPSLARPHWMAPPNGDLGGWVPVQVELARSPEQLVLLGPLRAHAYGIEISIEIRSRFEHHGLNLMRPNPPGDGAIRFGVRFADGRSTSSAPSGSPVPDAATSQPVLVPRGGGGGGGRYRQMLWLWPTPAEGDIEFFMRWDFARFDERMVVLDGDAIRAGAGRAERLWEPLDEDEQMAVQRQMMEAVNRFSSASHVVSFSPGSDPAVPAVHPGPHGDTS